MDLPKKSFIEKSVEWAYRHNFLVHTINRRLFKAKILDSDFNVKWKTPQDQKNTIKIISIGQSHIDAAWKWRKEDTKNKKINVTFQRALMHMDMYANKPFTYTQNQAVYYEWVKDFYPEMWKEIKKRFKEGRWEVVDGSWVENDVNIPSGESLIRQRLIGQYFYLEHFGFMSDIAWADDVFGFPYQVPQILSKTNARYFLTNKFCYNKVNKWPYHTLLWRGPDGESEVLLAWNQHKNNWHKYLKTFRELSPLVKEGVEAPVLNYMSDFDAVKSRYSEEILPYTVNVYGEGDGGNGPQPLQIIEQLCWDDDGLVKMGTMKFLFDILEPYRHRIPIWQDELYLENHQGTLTSIHMIKENNKTSEVLLHAIEFLNVLNVLGGYKNIQPELVEIWKKVLFLQFHDVLPGSSIIEVYRDAAKDYQDVYSRLFAIYGDITQSSPFSKINQIKINELGILNQFSWERCGIVSIPIMAVIDKDNLDVKDIDNLNFEILDSEGTHYNSQILPFPFYDSNREFIQGLNKVTGIDYLKITDGTTELSGYIDPQSNQKYLWIRIPPVKCLLGFEFRKLIIRNYLVKTQPMEEMKAKKSVFLVNNLLKVEFDPLSADIVKVLLNNKEQSLLIRAGLTLFKDPKTEYDAWNLDPNYFKNPVDLPEIESYELNDSRGYVNWILFKSKPSKNGTVYYLRYFLIEEDPTIYCDIAVNWQESYKLLKFVVEPNFKTEEIRSGMQYGSIKRVTIPKNRFNDYNAKFEYANQQWSSVCGSIGNDNYEVILINRNKYGIFAQGSKMMLSLLKSAKFTEWTGAATLDDDNPRPDTIDLGFQRITIGISFKEIENPSESSEFNWRSGYEFNFPLISFGLNRTNDQIFSSCSQFIKLVGNPKNISIGCLKMSEKVPEGENKNLDWFLNHNNNNNNWIILRIAEYYGTETSLTLQIHPKFKIKEVKETDMLERDLRKISLKGIQNINLDTGNNQIILSIKPYEIKTIAININR